MYIYIYKYISVLESSARFARVLDAGPWWALPWALGPPLSCPLGCGPSSGLSPGPSPGGPGPFAGLWRGPAGIGRSQGPIKYVKTPNDIEYVKLDQFLQSKLIFSGYVGMYIYFERSFSRTASYSLLARIPQLPPWPNMVASALALHRCSP